MKVAVLGTGSVGQTLARGFAQRGDDVVIGTRDPDGKSAREAAQATGLRVARFADTVGDAAIVVLALKGDAVDAALDLAGRERLAGKLVIDTTNPLGFVDGAPVLTLGFDDSLGERIQAGLPGAKVVKAFNIVTAQHMVHPRLADGAPDMFIAGDDDGAKLQVAAILGDFGWAAPIDLGGIRAARLLEPLAMVWISYGFRNNHWTHAFKLLRR
jgi:predicted dinucleotide-binding enzyme